MEGRSNTGMSWGTNEEERRFAAKLRRMWLAEDEY